jgi:hypothetical protein
MLVLVVSTLVVTGPPRKEPLLIFSTFVSTLHLLPKIGALLLLFTFICSILGMIILGEQVGLRAMNYYLNFANFQAL